MVQDQLSKPWRVSGEVVMVMGESDGSVAPLEEQAEAVRPFTPKGVPFRVCRIPGDADGRGRPASRPAAGACLSAGGGKGG